MPEDPDRGKPFEISAWITDSHAEMTHYVVCPVCKGRISFNLAEMQDRKSNNLATSIYCCGRTEPNPRADCAHFHDAFDKEPIYEWSFRQTEDGRTARY